MTTTATDSDLCPCGQGVEAQYQRHATQAEYDALPEGLRPIDGVALIAVKTCGDCLPPDPCRHPPAEPVPCPDCQAQPGKPCTGRRGGPRPVPHASRAAAQPVPVTCRHAHRETCTDPRHCHCTGDDPAPVRAPRVILPPSAQDQAAALGLPHAMLPHALEWLTAHGIDPGRVRGGFRTGLTQDNRPAILFDYVIGDDGHGHGHGHEIVETRVVPIETPR